MHYFTEEGGINIPLLKAVLNKDHLLIIRY